LWERRFHPCSAFVFELDGLKLAEPPAAICIADEDREPFAGEFAAALGEDRRTTGETWALLLTAG